MPRRTAHSRRHRNCRDMRGYGTPVHRSTGTSGGTTTFERPGSWRTNRSRSATAAAASTTWAKRMSPPPSDGHGTLSATSSALTARQRQLAPQPWATSVTTASPRSCMVERRRSRDPLSRRPAGTQWRPPTSHAHPGGSATTGRQADWLSQHPRARPSSGTAPAASVSNTVAATVRMLPSTREEGRR
jgi:hypothetical protein